MADSFVGMFTSNYPKPVLNDPRVAESWGGGWAPEQHTGTLIDGRRFYFRTRGGYAQLHVNTVQACEEDATRLKREHPQSWDGLREGKAYPPCVNPEFDSAEFDLAHHEGREYTVSFWSDEMASETLPDEVDYGRFMTQERRDESFKRLLDEIEAERAG